MFHKQPQHTAIISDLHLTEAEPPHPKYKLWKKYKTAEFFFDNVFESFLAHIVEKSGGEPVELILNGDIFDFDSVTAYPKTPPYRVSELEKTRGLYPQEEKSRYKMKKIIADHQLWFAALKDFVDKGNTAVFIIGNHDLELHFESVQELIRQELGYENDINEQVRFCEWFYISGKDTLVEHGNQYDPYCVCQNPMYPFVRKWHRKEVRIPFGNLATRYLINVMGYFNPHSEQNFIMSGFEYLRFFFKYMARSQPFIIWTWFWGSILILTQTFVDRFLNPVMDPMTVELRAEEIAHKAKTTPGVVRQLNSLRVSPATSAPWKLVRELWLDRAFIILIALVLMFSAYEFIDDFFPMSPLWLLLPALFFLPPFIFYAKSVGSEVGEFKEPQEPVIMMSALAAQVSRVVYGHTHIKRHEIIGGVEHLNSGTWSPAFLNVECTEAIDQKTYVWIEPCEEKDRAGRRALLLSYES